MTGDGLTNECGETGQSPINIPADVTWKANADTFVKTHKNLTSPTATVVYNGAADNVATTAETMGFTSTYAATISAPESYEAQQFHWHQGSEHTIDDVRFDLEVHTVH